MKGKKRRTRAKDLEVALRDIVLALRHDPVCAEILADTADLAARTDVVGSARVEIYAAVLGGNEVIGAAERLALEVVRQGLALWREDGHRCRLCAWRCNSPACVTRIRAGPQHREDAAFGVHRERTCSMGV